ncbi:MAG TPA: PQQ-binding-like beta-propeller repeat protein, partial [Verrucomicrobiae bacterium]|nr:PQQ-binding-like beta-propeller repeat protein [Verrucomicrobiae bacterium]
MLACLVVNAASVAAAPGEKRWELPLGACIYGAPALATNGDLLVTTCEGRLYAVTPSGTVRWSFQTSQSGLGTPTVADDGTIYFGSDKLYALNPDGSKRWEFAYSDPYTGYTYYLTDPLVGPDGAIYVARYAGNGEQRLFAVSPDGSLRWILKERFSAPPVIAEDGTLYLPEDYGFFAAVNPDGLLRWKVQVGNSTYASATPIAGGSVLVPVSGPNILEGSIQALNSSGSNLWRFEGGSPALGSPVVGPDGTIYYCFNAGRVVALEPNGQLRWASQIENLLDTYPSVWSPALAADGTLYVNVERWLHALNPSGQLLWRFDAGRFDLGPPMIGGDGTVYFGSGGTNGVLYAVEGTGAPLAASGWPMARRDTRHRASIASPVTLPSAPTNLTATLDAHTDKVILRWNSVPRATHYQLLRGALPDLGQAAVLVDGFTGTNVFEDRTAVPGASYQYFVRATNLAGLGPAAGPVQGRRRVASAGETLWTLPTGGAINGSPAIGSNGNAFAVSSDGHLYAADSAGHLRWTFKYGGRISGSPSVDSDGTIYFAGATNRYPAVEHISVWAITDSGQLKWRLPLDADWASDVAIGSGGELYVTARLYPVPETYRLIAMSRDGAVQWSFSNGQIFDSPPIIAVDGTIYCGTRVGQVLALRPGGTLLWEFASEDPYLGALILDANGGLVIGSISMQALNPDGQSRWRFPFSNGGGPWCIDPNGVIYGGNADRRVYALFPQGTRKWDVAIAGEPRGAAVGADGAIYVTQAVWFPPNTTLSAFSAAGVKQWDFNEGGAATGAPTIGNGIVCFGAGDGLVYAVKTAGGPAPSAWPQTRQGPERTGRATQAPPAPAGPSSVNATLRTRVTDVRVSWNSVIGASAYQVFRSATTNVAQAALLGELTGQLFFDDNSAIPETAYTYWIKAKNVTGVSPFSAPASGMRRQAVSGELLYEWNLGGIIDRSPAVGDDGTVYVSVNLPTFGSTDPGRKVVALRPDGTIRWQYWTGKAMLTAPTLSEDGTIYVGIRGALNQFPYPSPLLALNPDGTKRWELMADDAIETTPALGQDGTIYVGSAIGTLYAVTSGGQSTWSTNLGSGVGSLAVGRDRTVYALLRNGRLAAVRPDGNLLWEVLAGSLPLGDAPLPGVAIADDGAIYVSCGFLGLKALNPDGTVRWQTPAGNTFYTTPTVASNGLVILGDNGTGLQCYGPGGSNVWSATTAGSPLGAAALSADGLIYLAAFANQLRAFTLAGSNAW